MVVFLENKISGFQKLNLSLYSPYYVEVCNEFVVPIFATLRQGNTAPCVDVEAVANHLQSCVRFGRSGN